MEKARRLCHMMSVRRATFIYFRPPRGCVGALGPRGLRLRWSSEAKRKRSGLISSVSISGLTHRGERPLYFNYSGFSAVKTFLQQVQSCCRHLPTSNTLQRYPTERTSPISLFRRFKRPHGERIIIKIHHFIIRQIPLVLSGSGRYNWAILEREVLETP